LKLQESNVNETAATGVLWTEPLHERAAARIREMIVQGRLVPGEPISEKDLCDEFGVSRTPLREALKIVASEGLIELLPRRGAIVTPIVTEQLHQKFEIVRLLEDFAVKLVCERATDAQIEKLQAVHERLLESFKQGGTGFIDVNDEFHRTIMEASGNQSLVEAHAPLWLHLRRARRLVVSTQDVSRGYVQSHERLMKAIRKRDSAAAVREMEARWEIAERVLEHLAVSAKAGPASPSTSKAGVSRPSRGSKPRAVK
jgi:DNA-binding GntR family transcriptional regulator